MKRRVANVWYQMSRVGTLRESDNNRLQFTYDHAWIDTGFPISLTLPLSIGDEEVEAHDFFTALLPEGQARLRVVRQQRLSQDDDVALLYAIGRDCAGALTILPADAPPPSASEHPALMTAEQLSRLVQSHGQIFPESARPQRFSLAGAQDKIAIILRDNSIALSNHQYPSNAIIKFQTLPWVCFAEYVAMELARRMGFAVPKVEFRSEGDTPYLIVHRYDRQVDAAGNIVRLHQEDLCQALAYPSTSKYEEDEGPSLAEVASTIRQHVLNPVGEIERLRDWQLYNYLAGNFDGHAKNISLLYPLGSSVPSLAPFYDLVCIEFMNRIGASSFERSLAFFVGGQSRIERITKNDWQNWAKSMGFPPRTVLARLQEMAETLPQHATEVRASFAADYGDNQVYDYFSRSSQTDAAGR